MQAEALTGHAERSAIELALRECEREPIHIPGAIQTYGVLLSVDPNDLVIQNASENTLEHWGVQAKDLVGRELTSLLTAEQLSAVRTYVSHRDLGSQAPLPLSLPMAGGSARQTWMLIAHTHLNVLFLELEPVVPKGFRAVSRPFHRQVRDSVMKLQGAKSLLELCECAAEEVRSITGFERVMIYKFDKDWNGQVIAESIGEGAESYQGHFFPASDIPAQARAIFYSNWLRMIPDANYRPVRIHPGQNPATGGPLDLGKSMLRSVSPIHLQYLRNMNVGASLTVSLIDGEKLWGIIACHHSQAHLVDADDRLAAQLIGQIVSSQIRVKEELEDLEYKKHLKTVHSKLLSFMQTEEDLVHGLVKYSPTLLDISRADGAAAAIYFEGQWTLVGQTPSIEQIEELVTWLSTTKPGTDIFSTDSLSQEFPPAAAYKRVASGLLAASIPKTRRNYLLWFRPEVPSTVVWAGNPAKAIERTGDGVKLNPLSSFESWKQVVTGTSYPWKQVEIEAVEELRISILALDLERQFLREQAERARAERLSREKEDLIAIVSHDLKTPLNVAKLSFDLLKRNWIGGDEKTDKFLKTGSDSVRAMERLIYDLLDIAKIESGTLELESVQQDVSALVTEVAEMTKQLASEKGITLTSRVPEGRCMVTCERTRIYQVLSNLVGNALKFTPPGGTVEIAIEACGEEAVFSVADSGKGIATEHQEKIFDRFWQAKDTSKLGTGLGLSISRGIVIAHGGRMWVESEIGKGAKFYFSLPKSK